jgi:hypothetical protein
MKKFTTLADAVQELIAEGKDIAADETVPAVTKRLDELKGRLKKYRTRTA